MRLRAVQLSLLAVTLILSAARATAQEAQREPIAPTQGVIQLFNGKDLSGLYTFLKDTKYEDPRQVFTVHDGLLHISGDGFGGVITKEAYRNYHMICEFKWGERTWGSRVGHARDSGILVHGTGADDTYGGVWMESIEAQLIEGGTGDFIVVNGKGPANPSLTCEVSKDRDGESVWTKGGEKQTFTGGRINWYGRDPNWDDVIDFRGPKDVENPHGQWNRMEVICDGGRVAILLNGVQVNEGFDVHPAAGKLTIQTEGAEIFIRRWELWPLGQAPKFDPASLQK
jgi:hypothetical protein